MGDMENTNMIIRLQIDPKSDKVLYAEASKDFVDFLFFLLSLPIGTVTKLLTSESMVGSFGNLYTSFANLNQSNLQPNIHKNLLLDPMIFSSVSKAAAPLPINGSSVITAGKFYTCADCKCKSGITNTSDGIYCVNCSSMMNEKVKFVNLCIDDKVSEGYVKHEGSYMVSDDLSVSMISTMSIVSMLNKFNVTNPEERRVKIGTEEALQLLKTSFQSTSVLTDVFLKKKAA